MEKLLQLCELFNTTGFTYPTNNKNEILSEMTDMYRSVLAGQYFTEEKYTSGVFGASQLGKPNVVLLWDHYFGAQESNPSFAQKRKWKDGHLFELDVYYYLRRLGYQHIQHQATVKVFDLINGHPDMVVTDPDTGKRFIVECKHVSDSRYKQYQKNGMSQSRQYQVQLAMYCTHLNCGGLWVVGNTDTGEIMAIPILEAEVPAYNKLVMEALVAPALANKHEHFWQCLETVRPPKPLKRKDGTYYIPPSMYLGKGTLHPACALYEFYMEDGKVYVTGYNYPNEAKQWEPLN